MFHLSKVVEVQDGMHQQKLAVDSGIWATFRYNPELKLQGKNPMLLDCKEPKIPVEEFMYNETHFSMVEKMRGIISQTHHRVSLYL